MTLKKFCCKFGSVIDAFFVVVIVALVLCSGALDALNRRASDYLYQRSVEGGGDIIVIGIDDKVLDKYGVLAFWERRKIAEVIEYLNRDDNARPAVIGVDTIFTGENPLDKEGDEMLVKAARAGNVVFAASAKWKALDKNGVPYADYLDLPYTALTEAAEVGNVWLPGEKDGVTRHGLLSVKVKGEDEDFLSFSRVVYEKWRKSLGQEINPPPAVSERGVFYLPFVKENFGERVNIDELLEGKLKPEDFKDKIVLVGICASGMGDDFTVALNHKRMYGVDIHANEIAAFHRNFFPKEIDDRAQFAFLIVVLFIAEIYFQRDKMFRVVVSWAGLSLGWPILCALGYFYGGVVLQVLYLPLFASVLFIGAIYRNYDRARTEQIRLSANLGRYFDPAVMEKITAKNSDALRLGGKAEEIAVLFADIRDFTAMSEKFSDNPEAVADILNRYLKMTSKCVRDYNGTLDKFVGDQIMAFWNAPIAQEKAANLACLAALDMLSNLPALKREVKSAYGVEITFGIGIHWGKAVVGNIGSDIRMDYTAIGDTVNTAARLETNAPGGKIYISRNLLDMLGNGATAKPLEKILTLKGKTEEIEIFELISLQNER
ncbi:MAG: adenylate/guanylate cyclase domain-containing protein [Selenomonadaceae bacterium]|nr:adenylate/guanylate cyclase domain-containing protein [Selenomonadaceae bacterium]